MLTGPDYGDSNIIDLYEFALGLENEYITPLVRRSLIDTGPKKNKIANAIIHALVNHGLPLPESTPHPQPIVPRLYELQVTHLDQDHIGNAVSVLNNLNSDQLPPDPQPGQDSVPLIVRYSDIPPAMPNIDAHFTAAEVVEPNIRFEFRLDNLIQWQTRLGNIGLVPIFAGATARLSTTQGQGFSVGVSSTTVSESEMLSYLIPISMVKGFADYLFGHGLRKGTFEFGFLCEINDTTNETSYAPRSVLRENVEMSLDLRKVIPWMLAFIGDTLSQNHCKSLLFLSLSSLHLMDQADNELRIVSRTSGVVNGLEPMVTWNPPFEVVTRRIAELEALLKTRHSNKITHERPLYGQSPPSLALCTLILQASHG